MNRQVKRYFVTGTDTGVGKTILSLLMMRFCYERGDQPFYIKPLQTGCRDPYDTDSDAKLIYENVKDLKDRDPADSMIYCYQNPKAPYFAARDEGKEADIDPEAIAEFVDQKAQAFNPLVIEGAGGLFVPVDRTLLMIDLIKTTHAQPVVAARAGLGTINHTLLTLEALKKRDLRPAGLVLMDSGPSPTSEDMIGENIEAIETASGVGVAGVIGRIPDFSDPGRAYVPVLDRMLGQ